MTMPSRTPVGWQARRQRSRIPAAATVRPGNDLKEVTVGILEINAAPAIMMIDLARLRLPRVGPIGKLSFADPAEDLVELKFADQECVVLGVISPSVSM
jgi:hypothetical protein